MTRALTIRQPHASLVAMGVKTLLDQPRKAPASMIGQRLIIHAGAKRPEHLSWVGEWSLHTKDLDPGEKAQMRRMVGVGRMGPGAGIESVPLPLGAIVATATLSDCVPMVDGSLNVIDLPARHLAIYDDDTRLWAAIVSARVDGGHTFHPVSDQLPFGVFAPGRWAWILDDIKPTTERCPTCLNQFEGRMTGHHYGSNWDWVNCQTCMGEGSCPPVPATGKQGLWEVSL